MKILLSGVAMGESPRWHDGLLWFSDWGAREIVTVDAAGRARVGVRVPFDLPFCFDWLPDGPMLIVAGREARVLRREPGGALVPHADLRPVSPAPWNEIVVDGRGNAYVNGMQGGVALLSPDGSVRQVAEGLAFPNGMAVTPDNATLIVAESHAGCLTAFDIAPDGSLSGRRVWAAVQGSAPDGICLDSDGAVWYADVPNASCVRVREGGEVLQRVAHDRGCFACMLGGGGPERRTLYVVATVWRGMDKASEVARERTGQVLAVAAPAAGVGWP